MKRTGVFSVWCFLLVFVLSCAILWAQATAQISGTVKDQSGAVLPGVEITVTRTDTGISRTTITNETGFYVLPNLAIGPYRLEASLPGFRTYVQSGIVLQVNASPVINAVLEVGQVTEQIEVQANAVMVETRSTSLGTLIENTRILELPLNGRNVQDLIELAGGAVNAGDGRGTSLIGAQSTQISVGGGAGFAVDYTLDGANHNSFITGSTLLMPFPDAMQEFKVERSGVTADRAKNTSVAAVTKSGTNDLHGNLFEFARNDQFNARQYFATRDSTLKRHQLGGTLGGPIVRNKLFFFGGLQRTTLREDPAASRAVIPTAEMLAGDWTTFASPACNAGRQITLPQPFVNSRIDPARFSPAALKIVTLQNPKPFPKTDNPCGEVTYSGSAGRWNDTFYVGRTDYQQSAKHSVFGRFMIYDYGEINPEKFNTIYLQASGWRESQQSSYTLGSTYLFGANTVQSFRFAVNTSDNRFRQPEGRFNWCDAGVKIHCEPRIGRISGLSISGGFGVNHGFEDGWKYFGRSYSVNDDVSLLRGSHQFAFGGMALVGRQRNTGITWGSQSRWRFQSLAHFMTGQALTFFIGQTNTHIVDSTDFSLYASDTWRATPTVTLSYGVRWEPFVTPDVEAIYNFDENRFRQGIRSSAFRNAPVGLHFRGDPGFPENGVDNRWGQFSPRVGVAWDVAGDGRTSARASYSLSYIDYPGNFRESFSGGPPWGNRLNFLNVNLDDPWRNIPGGNIFPYQLDANAPFPAGGLYFYQRPDTKQPYAQAWNLSLERQIGRDWLVSASYTGNNMVHVWGNQPLNPAIFFPGVADANGNCVAQGYTFRTTSGQTCSTRQNTEARRRLTLERPNDPVKFAFLTATDDGGVQQYQGMILSVQRRVAQGATVNANYTWSHCIGPHATLWSPMSMMPENTYVNPFDRDFDRGQCDSDRRHLLNFTAVAATPQFTNPTLRVLASNWRISALSKYSSGNPLNIVNNEDRALNGLEGSQGVIQRANQVLANPYGSSRPGELYLNPAAFQLPALGTLGNIRRNALVGPARWDFDMALSRIFRFRERHSLEFRAEAYNVTNSFRPENPDVEITNRNFGLIRGARSPRILQFALKYVF